MARHRACKSVERLEIASAHEGFLHGTPDPCCHARSLDEQNDWLAELSFRFSAERD